MNSPTLMSFNALGTKKIVHDIATPFPYRENLSLVLELLHNIKRFNGTINFSVLQHTLLGVYILNDLMSRTDAKYADNLKEWLFHDMHEIILNDIPAPIKRLLRSMFNQGQTQLDVLENNLKNDVNKSFNLKNKYYKEVKILDDASYTFESEYFQKTLDLNSLQDNEHIKFYNEIKRLNYLNFEQLEREFLTHLALISL